MNLQNKTMSRGKYMITLIMLLSLFLVCITPVMSQKKERTRLRAYYEKQADDYKKLSVILTQGSGKNMRGVANAGISVTAFDAEETVEITNLVTDSLGEVVLYIEDGFVFPKNEEGFTVLNLVYDGNDSLRGSDKEIEFKDLNLEFNFSIIDSVRTVEVLAFERDTAHNKLPISEIEIKIRVKRLFSALELEEVETDEEGIARLEFPDDIPGDSIGMITVIAFVDDDNDYGTVRKTAQIEWGNAVDYNIKSNGRSLYGESAPLWMIFSVAILLTAAWFHFLIAVFKILKLNKLV